MKNYSFDAATTQGVDTANLQVLSREELVAIEGGKINWKKVGTALKVIAVAVVAVIVAVENLS